MRVLWLPDLLRDFGVDFDLHDGWETRGPEEGFDPKVVIVHHTAVAGSAVKVCINGRADLPGPLCHIVLDRKGRAHVIASGRANHAGQGGWAGYQGNRSAIGIEADNDGREPWNTAQLDVFHLVSAACLAGIKQDPSHLCAHREWAPGRKVDPHTIDMNEFRAAVGLDLQWWRNKNKQGDDMAYKDWDGESKMLLVNDIASEVVKRLGEDKKNIAAERIKKAAHAAQHVHDHLELKDA